MKKSGGSKVEVKSERYAGKGAGSYSGDGNMNYLSENDKPNKKDEKKVKAQKYKDSRYD